MSFSSELLDGLDLLNKRTVGVLKSCEDIASLLKEVAKIERDYGKSLLKLAQSGRKEFSKSEPMRKEVGTTFVCWDTILAELEKVGEHHSALADKVDNELVKDIGNYVKEKNKTKKKLESDGQKISKDYKSALDNLQKARSKYITLSKEADKAEAEHTSGKGNVQMKPAQLAKLAAKASQASEKAAASDAEYKSVLQITNQKQTEYYTQSQPNLLKEYQQWEEDRIKFMKGISEKFASFQQENGPFYNGVAQTLTSISQSISSEQDIAAFAKENKTGVSPPSDIQYQGHDVESTISPGAIPKSPKPVKPSKKSGKYQPGSGSDSFLSSREWGLSSADGNLSIEEQQSKLTSQMEELEKELTKETKTKEGLDNLVRFYASDPVAQKKAEDQVKESESKIQHIQELKSIIQGQIDGLTNGGHLSRSTSGMKVRGIYDYNATAETELSFKTGDILVVVDQDDSGWWYCELNGKQGFVPNNYVETIH